MAEKRKSVFKHPSRCRRNRSSTPTPNLLSPYPPGPDVFISSIGHVPYSGANPSLSFDSNPIHPNFSVFSTESGVVQDLSSRSTAQSVLPPQIDWYGPSGSNFSYIDSPQSNPMTFTSGNFQSNVQKFFEGFRLPDYTLDSFSGRLLDVVANTAFSSGNVQVELHHAITRLLVVFFFVFIYYKF